MSWRPLVEVLPVVDSPASPSAETSAFGSVSTDVQHAHMPELDPSTGLMALPQAHARTAHKETLRPSRIGNAQGSAEELAELREQARKEGYEEGAALGRAEQEAQAMRYRAAVEELTDAREETIKACESDVVRLALAIAREVLLADAPLRQDFASRMAEQALSMLAGPEPITLRMHPRDVQALQETKPDLVRRPDLNLIEDASLEMGGIIAEGGRGRLDATIEARLTQIAHQLLHETQGSAR